MQTIGSRRAFTLVEVLISVAILGLAMAPIVGMMHKSFGDIRAEKDEATAASIAGQLLNQFLFGATYEDVLGNSSNVKDPEDSTKSIMPTGNKTVDGTYVEWDTTVQAMTNSTLKFIYRRYKYHPPDGCGASGVANLADPALFYADDQNSGSDPEQYKRPVTDVDKKYAGLAGVMCEVELKIRWRPPGATTFTKEEKLYVRRAKLD